MKINEVNSSICEALGLSPWDVSRLDIRLRPDALPEIVVVHVVSRDALETVLRRYTLVPKCSTAEGEAEEG